MKNLLDVINSNLEKNYKDAGEFSKDIEKGNVNMTKVAESMFEYINYQTAIENTDISQFKTKVVVKKDV